MSINSFFGPKCVKGPFSHMTHFDYFENNRPKGGSLDQGDLLPLIVNDEKIEYTENKNYLAQQIASRTWGSFATNLFSALMGRPFDYIPFQQLFIEIESYPYVPHTFRIGFSHFLIIPLLLDSLVGLLDIGLDYLSDKQMELLRQNSSDKSIENNHPNNDETILEALTTHYSNLYQSGNVIRFGLQGALFLLGAVIHYALLLASTILKVSFALVTFIPAVGIGAVAKLMCENKYPELVPDTKSNNENDSINQLTPQV